MTLDMAPAVLWCIGVVCSCNVTLLCVLRGRLLRGYSSEVRIRPVSWNVLAAHVASLIFGITPYLIYVWYADTGKFTPKVRDFYAHVGWPSAAVAIALILMQILCMYLQARRAMFSEMDERLSRKRPRSY